MLELRKERPLEQELLEQAQEQGEGPCGPIRGGRDDSFYGDTSILFDVPNSDSKSMEVIDDVIALVSVVNEGSIDPEEKQQLGVIKVPAGELI